MKSFRFAFAIAVLTIAAACAKEKVQPDESGADSALTPEQKEAKAAEDYKKKQAAFADSVLGNSANVKAIAEKLGKGYNVGTVAMRDTLLKHVGTVPQCYADGKNLDPYLAGTVTFFIHMNPAGSDVVRVQEGQWTSQAGAVTEKCFNDAARTWKFPMGMAAQGAYLLQVQFK